LNNSFKEKSQELDRNDDLAHFRNHFHFPEKKGKPSIYLCGNSLGLQPTAAQEIIEEELKKWRENGVEGHFTGNKPWVNYHQNSKKTLAKLVGAKEEDRKSVV